MAYHIDDEVYYLYDGDVFVVRCRVIRVLTREQAAVEEKLALDSPQLPKDDTFYELRGLDEDHIVILPASSVHSS